MAKVLVADDSFPVRDVIGRIASSHPSVKEVVFAENGYEAVRILKSTVVDLLLLDLEMPRLSGFEVMEILSNPKQNDIVSQPKIIVITGHGNSPTILKIKQSIADACILKPINARVLHDKIDEFLSTQVKSSKTNPGEMDLDDILDKIP